MSGLVEFHEVDVLFSLIEWRLLELGRFGYYFGCSGCAQSLILVRAVMVMTLKNGGNRESVAR